MNKENMTNGLLLSGGGARGAYQLGVFFALYKYHFYSSIKVLSGASIGSWMSLGFIDGRLIKLTKMWKMLSLEKVYDVKDNYRSRIPLKGQGLFSREAAISYLKENYDIEKLCKTKIVFYVSMTEIRKRKFIPFYKRKTVLMNNRSEEDALQYLLASSAIPYIFDQVEINGNNYWDSLKSDSEPLAPFSNHHLDVLFVIPLSKSHSVERFKKVNCTVVDFMHDDFLNLPMINMLDFSQEKFDKYLSLGYQVADKLLKEIHDKGLLELDKKERKYLSLNSLGLKIEPSPLLTINEIIVDSGYVGE